MPFKIVGPAPEPPRQGSRAQPPRDQQPEPTPDPPDADSTGLATAEDEFWELFLGDE